MGLGPNVYWWFSENENNFLQIVHKEIMENGGNPDSFEQNCANKVQYAWTAPAGECQTHCEVAPGIPADAKEEGGIGQFDEENMARMQAG